MKYRNAPIIPNMMSKTTSPPAAAARNDLLFDFGVSLAVAGAGVGLSEGGAACAGVAWASASEALWFTCDAAGATVAGGAHS